MSYLEALDNTMNLLAFFVTLICIASTSAAATSSGQINVTDKLRNSVNVILTKVFDRLNSHSRGDQPLVLLNIQRIVRDLDSNALYINAVVSPIPELCNLILKEDAPKRLDIECGGRKWQVMIRREKPRRRRDTNDEKWKTVHRRKWDELRAVVNRGLAQLDHASYQILSNIWNIRQRGKIYEIEGVIEYPRQLCKLEVFEVPESGIKLRVFCGVRILETIIPVQTRRRRDSHRDQNRQEHHGRREHQQNEHEAYHHHEYQKHEHHKHHEQHQHEKGPVRWTDVPTPRQGHPELSNDNISAINSQSGIRPGLVTSGLEDITGDGLTQLNIIINNVLLQIESELGTRLKLIRIHTARRQIESHYVVNGEFSVPPTANAVCDLMIREDVSNLIRRDFTLTCGQNVYHSEKRPDQRIEVL